MMRTVTRLVGHVLTPVHIGDGTAMTPDGYRIAKQGNRDVLERFEPQAVIAAMIPQVRDRYLKALTQSDGLKLAQEILQKSAGQEDVRERIGISSSSWMQISEVVKDPLRTGRISPFVRSGGLPILPGSSLKGALRTAWLAAEAKRGGDTVHRKVDPEAARARPGKTGQASNRLQEAAFDYSQSRTEQDPLRDISIADVGLERDCTQIDRVHVANCSKGGPVALGQESKMQIHVERLGSLADGEDVPVCRFAMTIAALEPRELDRRKQIAGRRSAEALPQRSPGLAVLRQAVNAHHHALWLYERQRFFHGTGTDALMDSLLKAFGFSTDAQALDELEKRNAWLVRVGRYGHFESKSVEGYRKGEKRGTHGRETTSMSEGGSRTVARNSGGTMMPFGWLLLLPEADASAPNFKRPARPTAAVSPTGPSYAPPRPAPAANFRYRKGDKVVIRGEVATVTENVPFTATEMMVDFEGEREPVNVKDASPA